MSQASADDLVDILEQITDLVRADRQIAELREHTRKNPRDVSARTRLLNALLESGTRKDDPEVVKLTKKLGGSAR